MPIRCVPVGRFNCHWGSRYLLLHDQHVRTDVFQRNRIPQLKGFYASCGLTAHPQRPLAAHHSSNNRDLHHRLHGSNEHQLRDRGRYGQIAWLIHDHLWIGRWNFLLWLYGLANPGGAHRRTRQREEIHSMDHCCLGRFIVSDGVCAKCVAVTGYAILVGRS